MSVSSAPPLQGPTPATQAGPTPGGLAAPSGGGLGSTTPRDPLAGRDLADPLAAARGQQPGGTRGATGAAATPPGSTLAQRIAAAGSHLGAVAKGVPWTQLGGHMGAAIQAILGAGSAGSSGKVALTMRVPFAPAWLAGFGVQFSGELEAEAGDADAVEVKAALSPRLYGTGSWILKWVGGKLDVSAGGLVTVGGKGKGARHAWGLVMRGMEEWARWVHGGGWLLDWWTTEKDRDAYLQTDMADTDQFSAGWGGQGAAGAGVKASDGRGAELGAEGERKQTSIYKRTALSGLAGMDEAALDTAVRALLAGSPMKEWEKKREVERAKRSKADGQDAVHLLTRAVEDSWKAKLAVKVGDHAAEVEVENKPDEIEVAISPNVSLVLSASHTARHWSALLYGAFQGGVQQAVQGGAPAEALQVLPADGPQADWAAELTEGGGADAGLKVEAKGVFDKAAKTWKFGSLKVVGSAELAGMGQKAEVEYKRPLINGA